MRIEHVIDYGQYDHVRLMQRLSFVELLSCERFLTKEDRAEIAKRPSGIAYWRWLVSEENRPGSAGSD